MRLLICAGGTGGGVYPALSVWQAIKDWTNPGRLSAVLWVGGEGGMEAELVQREGIPFETIPASGLHGVGLKTLSALVQNGRGVAASRRILAQFKPDVLFFTGGFVAFPMAFAGRHIPTLLYVPDIEPGWALKATARFADKVALIADDSRQYFPTREGRTLRLRKASEVRQTNFAQGAPGAKDADKFVVTGHPVRQGLTAWDRETARGVFGFRADLPTLLVFGGSKGARAINRAVIAVLPQLLAEMQVLHISGALDWDEVRAAQETLPADLAPRYRAFPYLHEPMGAAYTVADLILSRAGASSVGEFPLFGLPAILVPYPHAWRYQKVNADYLTRHGAALMVPNEELPEKILPLVLGLMRDPIQRTKMQAAMRSLAHPNAAAKIGNLLFELGGGV
ncbi:MAG: UDP-N-acetylglucosamine--N-acetylmuramyl-(pentapeptide) pyrophosphoryl-undecaprenol N-acetylglucosamine transferase [Anaerolineales bacterium]|nr:UDP-N-acetylglucosamine--N-acetylmuramyl-(pentapeptide) pyrophosphoryl-undecaprenol N-acetylglucosamine transferase [Anaerolineales bacterium]